MLNTTCYDSTTSVLMLWGRDQQKMSYVINILLSCVVICTQENFVVNKSKCLTLLLQMVFIENISTERNHIPSKSDVWLWWENWKFKCLSVQRWNSWYSRECHVGNIHYNPWNHFELCSPITGYSQWSELPASILQNFGKFWQVLERKSWKLSVWHSHGTIHQEFWFWAEISTSKGLTLIFIVFIFLKLTC